MRLSAFAFASLLLLGCLTEGRIQRGAAGHSAPLSQPSVIVHVSEPNVGAGEFQSRLVANKHKEDSLLQLEGRITAVEGQLLANMKALAQDVKDVSDIIDVHLERRSSDI